MCSHVWHVSRRNRADPKREKVGLAWVQEENGKERAMYAPLCARLERAPSGRVSLPHPRGF